MTSLQQYNRSTILRTVMHPHRRRIHHHCRHRHHHHKNLPHPYHHLNDKHLLLVEIFLYPLSSSAVYSHRQHQHHSSSS